MDDITLLIELYTQHASMWFNINTEIDKTSQNWVIL